MTDSHKQTVKSAPAILSVIFCLGCSHQPTGNDPDVFCMPLLVGEVTRHRAIVQARLTATDTLIYGNIHDLGSLIQAGVKGEAGMARFEVSEDTAFLHPNTDAEASGGFLKIRIVPGPGGREGRDSIIFSWDNQHGKELYKKVKACKNC